MYKLVGLIFLVVCATAAPKPGLLASQPVAVVSSVAFAPTATSYQHTEKVSVQAKHGAPVVTEVKTVEHIDEPKEVKHVALDVQPVVATAPVVAVAPVSTSYAKVYQKVEKTPVVAVAPVVKSISVATVPVVSHANIVAVAPVVSHAHVVAAAPVVSHAHVVAAAPAVVSHAVPVAAVSAW